MSKITDSQVVENPDPEKTSLDDNSSYEAATRDESTGILYQSKAKQRKGFFKKLFLPLDKEYMEAVYRDAAVVVYESEGKEEKKIKRKIDHRILLFLILSFIFNLFDRTNIGNAHVIQEFNENFVGITNNNKWTLAVSIFYVGGCVLQIPANVLLKRIGSNRIFFITFTIWGIASLSVVYAKGYGAFLALRVLLSIGEAGFFAGVVYYLSFWYKRRELALRISLCMTGTIPGAIGGLLAFGLIRAHTSVLTGWQFLFLVEAVPTLVLGFLLLFFLPPFPFSASFLTPREKAILQARLNSDHKPRLHGGMNSWEALKAVIKDINVWGFMLVYTTYNIGVVSMAYFFPTIINEFGFSPINTQGMTVAPYVVAYFAVIFQSWHSDKCQMRGRYIMLSSSVACVGYIILACMGGQAPGVARGSARVGVSYFALFLVMGGTHSMLPLIMSWTANNLSPTSKRGVGTAFVTSIADAITIAAPQVYFDPEDGFRKGFAIIAGCYFLLFLVAFSLHKRLKMLNGRNRKILGEMSEHDRKEMDREDEVYDSDPRFVFVT